MSSPPSLHATKEGIHWPRAALLAPLGWWSLMLGSAASTWCFLDFVNLAFHEAGHLLFSFAGSTVHYLGGTLGQLLVPVVLLVRFLVWARQPFAAAVCCWWLGQNFVNISIYMADARELSLPLVGGGDHDWNELFFRFGLLAEPAVSRVATATHLLGVVVMLVGLSWALFFVLPPDRRERLRIPAASRWPWLDYLLEA